MQQWFLKDIKKGFTLIELLIVIAIIAILSVVFLPSLRGGTVAARDAARKAVIKDIITAIDKIISADIPPQVVVTSGRLPNGTPVGKIPVSLNGICLNFTTGLGKDIVEILGRTPASYPTNVFMCTPAALASGSGFFYKSFKSDGTATTLAADTAANYAVAVQLENKSNGNAGDPAGAVNFNWASPTQPTLSAMNTAFRNFSGIPDSVLERTSIPSTNKIFIISR